MTAAVSQQARLPPAPHTKIDEFGAYEQGVLLLNRYRKLADIQSGSYGRVSVALDTVTNSKVAVKTMNKRVQGVSAVARHEVSILKRLGKHENICALLDCFETSSHYFLVFEYCANGDLYDYLQLSENHLNPSRKNGSPFMFKQFVKDLISAVNYAHSRGVYHRDIKPENILIDASGTVKLTDWGLATIASKCFEPCIGTEKYMAPETFFHQSSKPKNIISYDTVKADYWSVGITMLYVLFGKCPFKLANISDKDFNQFINTPGYLLDKYPTLTSHGHEAIMQVLQLNPSHRSLDACIEVLHRDYTLPLTTEQIVENNEAAATQFADEIFTFDEEDENVDQLDSMFEIDTALDSTPTTYSSVNITSSTPDDIMAPPSLVESMAESIMGKSWADLDDWDADSFNFCVPKSLKDKNTQKHVDTGAFGRPMIGGDRIWY